MNNRVLFLDIGDCVSSVPVAILDKDVHSTREHYFVTERQMRSIGTDVKYFRVDAFSSGLPSALEGLSFEAIYFITDQSRIDELGLMQSIYSIDFGSLYAINSHFEEWEYTPFKGHRSKVLMVFPGAFVPIRMGSHQRAFNMITHLNANGVYTDLFLPLDKHDEESLSSRLKSLASRVFFYQNRKTPYPFLFRMRRKMDMFIKSVLGKPHRLTDLFSERDYRRASQDGKEKLVRLLKEYKYDTVIIHYAWMLPIKELVKEMPDVRWVCDTHDVQFVRNQTVNKHDRRYMVDWHREKALELSNLQGVDKILTISRSDHDIFQKYFSDSKLMLCHPGFEHLHTPVKRRSKDQALTFGFIGGKMMANVLALSYILEVWWPPILQRFPDARLLIAGSICFEETIIKQVFLDDSIERIGFINDLNRFYSQIDVLLSPVFIKGGLNFKNVEALMAGKHVMTNELGSSALEQFDTLEAFESIDEIIRFLEVCSEDIEMDFEIRLRHQQSALEYFSSNSTYAGLTDYLIEK